MALTETAETISATSTPMDQRTMQSLVNMPFTVDFVLKRITDKHVELLKIVQKEAPMTRQTLHRKYPGRHNLLMSLKNRGLIASRNYAKGIYRYDLTDFGLQVLNALETKKTE